MKKRILSVCVILTVTTVFLLLGRLPRLLFAVACAAVCCHDICKALQSAGYHVTPWIGWLFIALYAPMVWFGAPVAVMPLAFLLIFAALCVSVVSARFKPGDMLLSLGTCLYPLTPVAFVTCVLCLPAPYWYIVLLTGAASAAICDTFALFGGMRFGKHPLAPRISPHKTIEGAVCGLLSCIPTGIILYFAFMGTGVQIPVWGYILVSAVSSTFGQMGDLIASSFKRQAGLKDFSNLIPGHGGMLDRLDSHIFAIPAAWFLFLLAGWIIP